MRYVTIQLLALFFCVSLRAEPILTVMCEEPKGTRFDFLQDKLTTAPDGFKGVNPVFIIDSSKPGKLFVVWGPSKLIEDKVPTNAKEVPIVSKTENQITAIEVDPTGDAVIMYSLYPQSGVVYMTQHRYQILGGGVANSASYHAKAIFSGK